MRDETRFHDAGATTEVIEGVVGMWRDFYTGT
jgi:hypothetical protein